MGDNVSNADRTIVTKGTSHVAVATIPDVCNVPGGPPAPFPNQVKSERLAGGATTATFIDGQPIMTSAGELGPPSDPAHAGVGGGVASGTYIAEAKATSYSRDVFAESAAVVRAFDGTTQNHANTKGLVLPAALAADAAFLEALAGYDPECLAAASEGRVPFLSSG